MPSRKDTQLSNSLEPVDLVRTGYFPVELPPCFTTEQLAANFRGIRKRRRSKAELTRFSLGKAGGFRRDLGIPHPAAFTHLATEVSASFDDFEAHCAQSNLSMTRPTLLGNRAINRQRSFAAISERRAESRRDKRFIVQCDVHQCYPSIYTHSILWGIHTKPLAKAAFRNQSHKQLAGHNFDTLLRNCQDAESIGIPIGPDTSLLAAEIVLSRIDIELQQSLGCSSATGFRYMDGWELCFDSRTEAEDAAATLEAALSSFRLRANHAKTSVRALPLPLVDEWILPLRRFTIRETSETATINDLSDFFSLAYELRNQAPSAPVLKYAISKASRVARTPRVWQRYLVLALGALVHEPHALPDLSRFIARSVAAGLAGSGPVLEEQLGHLQDALCRLGVHHGRRSHSFETAWILWTMARFNLPLSADFESSIAGSDDDVITIMLLYCKEFGLTSETLQPRLLGEMQQTASLANSERWLLAYECERRGWASQPEISSDPYFEQLLKRGVDFLRNPQMPVPEVARNKLDIAQPTQRSTPPESPTQVPSPGPLLSSWLLDYDDLSPVDPGQEIPPADGETEDADYPD